MTEDNDKHGRRPTPGPNEPVPAWNEYEQLRDAIHNYLNHQPDDPAWDDIWRAFGAIMGEYQHDSFVQAFHLDEPAETAYIRRLITGETEFHVRPSKPTATRLGRLTSPRGRGTIRASIELR